MIISILGCGWLGFPLGQLLLQHKHTVKGSTTTESKLELLKKNGIVPFLIDVPDTIEASENEEFWNSDVLFLNIPPSRGRDVVEDAYPEKIEAICNRLLSADVDQRISKVVFASSTSVYPPEEGVYGEDNTNVENTARPSGRAVLKAEKVLLERKEFDTVILRFGGLYGYNRHPIRFLAGKKQLPSPHKPVNLIHQDDCIQIARKVIETESVTGIFNAVSDGHPPRKTLYQSAADHYDEEPPTFDASSDSISRVINNKKLKNDLGYSFIYPNPLDHTA